MGDSGDPFMRNQNAAVQARTKAQNRSNVLQLKLMGQSHPTGLTNNLLKLFEPRPPLEYKPPLEKRKCPPYTGMALFVSHFAEPGDGQYAPPKPEVETPAQKRERVQKLRLEKGVDKAAEDLKKYDPNTDPNATGDPYKTLFISRLNYESSESKIKREFESYGPIKRVQLVTDQLTNKPRGYAFIEYMHTRDMKAAYKQADGQKIDGRRVLVDVERGRTVPNWRPRRLGGGLGTSRVGGGEATVGEQQQQGRTSRSEEPREEREKSREKGKERERERSRELSIEQPREDRERESRRDRGGRDSRRDRTGTGTGTGTGTLIEVTKTAVTVIGDETVLEGIMTKTTKERGSEIMKEVNMSIKVVVVGPMKENRSMSGACQSTMTETGMASQKRVVTTTTKTIKGTPTGIVIATRKWRKMSIDMNVITSVLRDQSHGSMLADVFLGLFYVFDF